MTGGILEPDAEVQARQNRLIQDACAQAVHARLAHVSSARRMSDGVSPGPPALSGDLQSDGPPPDSFTGYQLIREIHRGGQGVVYQAIQKSTKRKVAIKVMKEGPFASTADRGRFEREVQVLAQLQHPNIVAIHDTGVAAGHQYFVMDYISGQPLDVHMAGGQRGVEETLRLFAAICDAVNAAHVRGVIHRDLKPGNIRIDGNSEPHILDFGLAKLPAGSADASMMTMTGAFVGSPPWASPEQAEGILSNIDTRTDVYSLGVILFQMLTGKLPYDVTGSMREVLARIQIAEPNRPSAIRRGLNDEVDTIILKCLAKERERRYQMAGELARDVRHYLAGDPIEAKRDSIRYVLFKQLRRFRLAATIAAGFVLVVTVGFITSLTLWRQAEYAQLNEGRQRKVAEAVNTFLQEMLSSANPDKLLGPDVTVRTALDAAANRVDQGSLRNEPETEAAVRSTIGSTYCALGLYEPAEAQLRNALEIRERLFGKEEVEVARALEDLAWLMVQKRDFATAESLLRRALLIRERMLGEDHPDVAATLASVAWTLQWQGDFRTAESLLRQALTSLRRHLGNDHVNVARSLNYLGTVLLNRDEYDEAERLFREALAIRRRLLGDEHPDVNISRSNLAMVLQKKGSYDEAESGLREALSQNVTILPREHRNIATSHNRLAMSLQEKGNDDEAERLYLEALAIARKSPGGQGTEAEILNNLADLYLRKKGDVASAEPLVREAVSIHRKLRVPQPVSLMYILVLLGDVLAAKGDPEGAQAALREALAIQLKTLPEKHWRIAYTESLLGRCLADLRQYDEAEPLLTNSYPVLQAAHGEQDEDSIRALQRIVDLYDAWGKPDLAAEYRAKLEASPPPER